MTRKTILATILSCCLTITPTLAGARQNGGGTYSGVGKAAAGGAAKALAVVAGAVVGTLTITGLTIWYFVHRAHSKHETAVAKLAESARLATTDVTSCVDETGTPALRCW